MRWYVLISLGLVVAGMAIVRWGRGIESSRPKTPMALQHPAETETPQSQLQDVRLVEQTDETTAWEIFADDASLYEARQVAVARGVQAQLFRDQAALLFLEADQGVVQRATGDIAVRGHVRVKHLQGYTITTEALNWQASSRTLHTETSVQIDGPAVQITGTGLRSNVDQQRLRLQRDVRASFRLR